MSEKFTPKTTRRAAIVCRATPAERAQMALRATERVLEIQDENGPVEVKITWNGCQVKFTYTETDWFCETVTEDRHFVRCTCGDISIRHGEEDEPECFMCGAVQHDITNPAQRKFEKEFFKNSRGRR